MARRMKPEVIAVIVIGGVVALYFIDRKSGGKLKFAAYIDRFIGQLKKMMGQGAGPIIPADLPEGGLGPSEAQETPEQFAKEMEMEKGHYARYY